MAKNEHTLRRVASRASNLLKKPTSASNVKSVAASALTQARDKGKKK